MEIDFETWFDIFLDCCRITHKYNGPIDRGTFKEDWEMGRTPEEVAVEFVAEMS